jgi:uncharacterized protein YndB with AHSA1/START domain
MVDIIHRIGIKAPLAKVFAAVSSVEGVAGWWTEETSGDSKLGGSVKVLFRAKSGEEVGRMTFEPIEVTPPQRVVWRFTEGPPEWLGTDVTFALSQSGEYTVVLFGHRNWREAVEFTHHCSTKWAVFLLSLKQLVETGAGRPSPEDLKIDDWN